MKGPNRQPNVHAASVNTGQPSTFRHTRRHCWLTWKTTIVTASIHTHSSLTFTKYYAKYADTDPTLTHTFCARGGWPGLYKQVQDRKRIDRWMWLPTILHWDYSSFRRSTGRTWSERRTNVRELTSCFLTDCRIEGTGGREKAREGRTDKLNTIWGGQFEHVNRLCFRVSAARPQTCQTGVAGAHQHRVIFSAPASWPVKSAPEGRLVMIRFRLCQKCQGHRR